MWLTLCILILLFLNLIISIFHITANPQEIAAMIVTIIASGFVIIVLFFVYRNIGLKAKVEGDIDDYEEMINRSIKETQLSNEKIVQDLKKSYNEDTEIIRRKYEKKVQELQDVVNNSNASLADERSNYTLFKQEFRNEIKSIKTKHFLKEICVDVNENDLADIITSLTDSDLLDKTLFHKIGEKIGVSERILLLLFNELNAQPREEEWKIIKDNPDDLDTLSNILEHSGKITTHIQQMPSGSLSQLLKNRLTFSLQGINQEIDFLIEHVDKIQDLYDFLNKEQIKFIKYSLWADILEWQRIYEMSENKILDAYWDICKKAIQQRENHGGNFQEIITYLYFKEKFLQKLTSFNLKICNDKESVAILYYILQNRKEEPLGAFIESNADEMIRLTQEFQTDPFFQAFNVELCRGRLVLDERKLFKIYRDEKAFDLSYLDHLLFNPDMPVDFAYAYDHYYNLKATVSNVLRNLDIEGKKKPLLLTFASEEGGIGPAINLLKNKDRFPILNAKYHLMQYGNSARLGIIEGDLKTLQQYNEEMIEDLKLTIPAMPIVNKIKEELAEFKEICTLHNKEIDFAAIDNDFGRYVNLEVDRDVILQDVDLTYKNALHGEDAESKKDLKDAYNNLLEQLDKYPPLYQILLHELEYSHEKIKIFGSSRKYDPFEVIKKDFARGTINKEILITSIGLEDRTERELTLLEFNEKLVNSLTLYALLSKQIREITGDEEMQDVFNEKALDFIIRHKYKDCGSLYDFCARMGDELIPKTVDLRLLDVFKIEAPGILQKHTSYLSGIQDIVKSYIENYNDSRVKQFISTNWFLQIAPALVNSCLCISTILFKEINDAMQFLNQSEIKSIKEGLLKNVDIEVIEEKKLIMVLNAIFKFHNSNLIRPLFHTDEVVSEPVFHDKTFQYLYFLFKDNIEDESEVARGSLDIDVHKVPVELKIENENQQIDEIYKKYKPQFDEYCYRKQSPVGIMCVYEYGEKTADYPKEDVKLFTYKENTCICIIIRGNLPFPSVIAKKKPVVK
nr:hypothetical protein [Candidatus Sigynarchaeota archaeon]